MILLKTYKSEYATGVEVGFVEIDEDLKKLILRLREVLLQGLREHELDVYELTAWSARVYYYSEAKTVGCVGENDRLSKEQRDHFEERGWVKISDDLYASFAATVEDTRVDVELLHIKEDEFYWSACGKYDDSWVETQTIPYSVIEETTL